MIKLTFVYKNNQGSMVRFVESDGDDSLYEFRRLITSVLTETPIKGASFDFEDVNGVGVIIDANEVLYSLVEEIDA